MLEVAKYSWTKRASRSESALPSPLRILSTTSCLSGPRSHRHTLAVAPLPRGLTGVKPVMPAERNTASASARRRASARAIMLAVVERALPACSAPWYRGAPAGSARQIARVARACGGAGGAFTSISAGGLCRGPASLGTRTIFGKLGLLRSSDNHSRPSRRRYSSSISMCAYRSQRKSAGGLP